MDHIPSLEDYLSHVPAEKLDQECSDDDLKAISQSLAGWRDVSPWLGLTVAEEEEVKHGGDLKRQRIDALRKWKENARRKDGATHVQVRGSV